MATAGEVMHKIGEAYQHVFIGALEASIPPFENQFFVHSHPEKTQFKARSGADFSFDFKGMYRHPAHWAEVFGECKGYTTGRNLLGDFKSFVAKAYVTSVDYEPHRDDYFWFVTNVPFACTEGSGVRSFDFIMATLKDAKNQQVRQIVGDGHIDENCVRSLVERIGVFILTDSFLLNTEISYKVLPGDNIWMILKKFHAGRTPPQFQSVAHRIASRNNLSSIDRINSGERIKLSWYGIQKAEKTTDF